MATTESVYSTKPGREVYHNNTACTERNNIERENLAYGTGGRRLCSHCKLLNAIRPKTKSPYR